MIKRLIIFKNCIMTPLQNQARKSNALGDSIKTSKETLPAVIKNVDHSQNRYKLTCGAASNIVKSFLRCSSSSSIAATFPHLKVQNSKLTKVFYQHNMHTLKPNVMTWP